MGTPEFLTVGELAEKLDCPIHKVQYLLTTRRIDPIRRVGGYRIFSPEVVERLKPEIRDTKAGAHHG